jgi:hypothetical protein
MTHPFRAGGAHVGAFQRSEEQWALPALPIFGPPRTPRCSAPLRMMMSPRFWAARRRRLGSNVANSAISRRLTEWTTRRAAPAEGPRPQGLATAARRSLNKGKRRIARRRGASVLALSDFENPIGIDSGRQNRYMPSFLTPAHAIEGLAYAARRGAQSRLSDRKKSPFGRFAVANPLRRKKFPEKIFSPYGTRASVQTVRAKRHSCINEICKRAHIVYRETEKTV